MQIVTAHEQGLPRERLDRVAIRPIVRWSLGVAWDLIVLGDLSRTGTVGVVLGFEGLPSSSCSVGTGMQTPLSGSVPLGQGQAVTGMRSLASGTARWLAWALEDQ